MLYTMVKMVAHIEARSIEILKLKKFLKKPKNLLMSLEFAIQQNCPHLRVKSQYKQTKRFTAKFSLDFTVTVSLTL